MSTVITIEGLSKKYFLCHKIASQPYVALRDVIADTVSTIGYRLMHPFRSVQQTIRSTEEEFWALKDVSFNVHEGERIGIIGRNGAGKSTLLKVLSRIIEPTEGRVRIKGRVSSLLEVGTGFHPELTGRENIFLNGAILGMTRAEIKKKFDEIVYFAEIEKFLDTPVKRYSSGMYVRLAFAVAAHLEPDILLVDEVLAVGDVIFQNKCLGKMKDISSSGRTIIFVSHQLNAIKELCERCLLFDEGKIRNDGSANAVIDDYLHMQKEISHIALSHLHRRGRGQIRFLATWTENLRGEKTALFHSGESVRICAHLQAKESVDLVDVNFSFPLSAVGLGLFTEINSKLAGSRMSGTVCGEFIIECELLQIPLNTGRYDYDLYCSTQYGVEDHLKSAGAFSVVVDDYFRSGVMQREDRPFFLSHRIQLRKKE
jgi:lipopolysaccharide transport system ATP-binding protein